MSDNNEITAIITTEEPAVAATLDELRYLVLQGKKGDTGDSAYDEAVKRGFEGTEAEWLASLKGDPGPRGFSPLVEVEETAAGHHVTFTDVSGETSFNIPNGPAGPDGVSPVVSVENITGGHRVTITDASGDHTFDVMDGEGGTSADAVLYTEQSLAPAQQAQARTNIGAGTYSKPASGIPASDLAAGVIPTVPQMATQADMSDWTSGETVDAAAAKTLFEDAAAAINGKVDTSELESAISNALQTAAAFLVFERQGVLRLVDLNDSEAATYSGVTDAITKNNNVLFFTSAELGQLMLLTRMSTDENTGECSIVLERTTATGVTVWTFTAPDSTTELTGTVTTTPIPTAVSELTNDSGYQTAQDVQTAIAAIPDELPTVTASDNGKFLRVVSGAWAAQAVPSAQGVSF